MIGWYVGMAESLLVLNRLQRQAEECPFTVYWAILDAFRF
jgi:hypothetical protein